ncbi:histidine kinase [Spirillospora sp. NPDC047279]|uniref:sensor histidine kinase n=1 Tax=Spirillospora sp. NPDC047279 TaxID=3155478 RepID=UPI0033F5A790
MHVPSLPARPVRAVVSDAIVVALGVGGCLLTTLDERTLLRSFHGATTVVLALTGLALVFRRRAPLTVAWITTGVALVLLAVETAAPGTLLHQTGVIDVESMALWPPTAMFAAYAVTAFPQAHRPSWLRALPIVTLSAALWLTPNVIPDAAVRMVSGQEQQTMTDSAMIFRSTVVVVGAALLGMYVSARRRVLDALRERAERAEREQHLLAEQARADERARLAAEMHDVVAHRVTLMVLQAGALRVRTRDPETREAAEEMRGTGAKALEELRDVIGLLRRTDEGRDDGETHGPLPDLSTLIAESGSIGVPVDLAEEGDPPLASPVVGRTAYRIVQEALTNVRKHAPGARVRVEVRYRTDGVRLTVLNSAPDGVPDPGLVASGSGAGLSGLGRRVALIGGSFRSGPTADGGFEIDASLPAFVPTPAPAPEPASTPAPEPTPT